MKCLFRHRCHHCYMHGDDRAVLSPAFSPLVFDIALLTKKNTN